MGLTTFTVDGWTGFLGYPWTTDDYGCDWHVKAETGWRGSPAARIDRVNRPRADGEIDPGQAWLGARVVELTGTVVAGSHAQLAAGMEQFSSVLAGGSLTTLTVVEDGSARQALVRRADSVETSWTSPISAAWSLTMLAPDPLKYDTIQTQVSTGLPAASTGLTVPAVVPWVVSAGGTSGTVTFSSAGTAPTKPTFTIVGPVTDPRIEHATTGRVLAFTGLTLGVGDTLVIDTVKGTVLLNGTVSRRGYLAAGSSTVASFSFASGFHQVAYRALSSPGGSSLTATFRAAWW